MERIKAKESFCFDTETTSLNALDAELVGIAFSWEAGKGYYLPFPEDRTDAETLLEKIRFLFENESVELIGQNLKYDYKVLLGYGVDIKAKLFDTMIAHYLINPDMRHNMDLLAETYLDYYPISITELIGKGKQQKSMRSVPPAQITEYAAEDADITYQLSLKLKKELKTKNLVSLFEEIEVPLLKVLAKMEMEGIRVDPEYLKSLSVTLTEDILQLQEKIYTAAGEQFNIASPKQLGEILLAK